MNIFEKVRIKHKIGAIYERYAAKRKRQNEYNRRYKEKLRAKGIIKRWAPGIGRNMDLKRMRDRAYQAAKRKIFKELGLKFPTGSRPRNKEKHREYCRRYRLKKKAQKAKETL